MNKKFQVPQWMKVAVASLIALILLFSAYYLIYVTRQSDQLDEYYLRVLSVTSDNIEDALSRLQLNIDNAQTVGDLQLIPVLSFEPSSDSLSSDFIPLRRDSFQQPELRVSDGEYVLTYREITHPEFDEIIDVNAPLNEVLRGTFPLDEFDAVLVMRQADGTVLLSRAQGPVDLMQVQMSALLNPDDEAQSSQNTLLQRQKREIGLGTQIHDVRIAGTAYKLFLQPIQVPISYTDIVYPDTTILAVDTSKRPEQQQQVWLLAGLQKTAGFQAQTRAIAPPLVFAALGLFILLLLSLPFLKVQFLGERERLEQNDVFVLVVALVITASILTFGLLEFLTKSQLNTIQDEHLYSFNREIDSALHSELNSLDRQLQKMSAAFRNNQFPFERMVWENAGNKLAKILSADTTTVNAQDEPFFQTYPFLEMAYWIDSTGQQQAKWSVKDRTTPLIDVSTRGYFQEARDGNLWSRSASAADTAGVSFAGYVVESIRSKATGKVSAVLSQLLHDTLAINNEHIVVSAILSPLVSVIGPAIPPDYGYCIIARDGSVLFHSNESRNLRENFYAEVNASDKVRAAVASRAASFIDATYRKQDHRIYSRPVQGTPWTLITFTEKAPLNDSRVEVLSFSFMLYSLYTLIMLIIFLSIYGMTARFTMGGDISSLHWFWPRTDYQGKYQQIVVVCVGILLAWLLTMIFWQPVDSLIGTVAFAVIGLTFSLFILLTEKRHVHHFLRGTSVLQKTAIAGLLGGFLITGYLASPTDSFMSPLWPLVCLIVGSWIVFARIAPYHPASEDQDRPGILYLSDAPLRWLLWFMFVLFGMLFVFVGNCLNHTTSGNIAMGGVSLAITVFLVMVWKYNHSITYRLSQWLNQHPSHGMITESQHQKHRARWYTTAALSILIIIGILPPVTMYRAMHDEVMDVFMKREQLLFAERLQNREAEKFEQYREIQLDTLYQSQITQQLFPSNSLDNAWDVHTAGVLMNARECVIAKNGDTLQCHQDSLVTYENREELLTALGELLPGFKRLSHDIRAVTRETSADSTWSWKQCKSPQGGMQHHVYPSNRKAYTSSAWLVMNTQSYRPDRPLGQGERYAGAHRYDLQLISPLFHFSDLFQWEWILLMILILGGLWIVIRLINFRVFLTDMLPPKPVDGKKLHASKPAPHRLILRADDPFEKLKPQQQGVLHIDASRQHIDHTEDNESIIPLSFAGTSTIIVTQLHDGLWDPRIAEKKLAFLEALVDSVNQKTIEGEESHIEIELHSDINPFHYFKMVSNDPSRETRETAFSLNRWSSVLEHFTRVRPTSVQTLNGYYTELKRIAANDTIPDAERRNTILQYVAKECWIHPYLREVGRAIAQHPDLDTLDDQRHVVNQVFDLAEDYYQRLWAHSGKDEKLTLNRLCKEGLVSWRSRELVRRLINRGLIITTPEFTPMNQSFRLFVLRAESREIYRQWEQEGETSLWSRFKWPVLVAMGAILLFFIITQRAVLQQTLAITAAAAAGAPALLKLLAVFTQQRGKLGSGE